MGTNEWHIERRSSFETDSPLAPRDVLETDSPLAPREVLETGTLSIVVLGASGDLAKKKTFPALFHLYKQVKQYLCLSCLSICNIQLL
jgi:glucose-6-phosphate 1-dehydrogenase